jgi:hypothetical protein
MTKDEIDARMVHYQRAYLEGRITKHEWLGFAQALRGFVLRGEWFPQDNVGTD